MTSKKALIVLILRILETQTNEREPLTQVTLANAISKRYPCDRKTVGRNNKLLQEMGFPIVKTPRGFYMDKKLFSRTEIEFILLAVRGTPDELCATIDKGDLCTRLHESLSRYYKAW